MTQDGKRRRGRRRARRDTPGGARGPEQRPEQAEASPAEPAEGAGPAASRRRFNFRRPGRRQRGEEKPRPKERATASQPHQAAGTSPMDFWRSGAARTYRDPRAARKQMGLWQRIAGFHFPAWFPVATIIVVVFAILAGLFFLRSAAGAPRVGDHWHAPYAIFIGDQQQPRIQEVVTQQGIHTHGDSVIHIHPHVPGAEGSGARLEHFFGDQGGRLSDDEMQIPGRDEVYRNGDDIDGDGKPEELRILRADSGIHPLGGDFNRAIVACNEKPESEFERVDSGYVAQDGDCIRIVFAEPEVQPVVEQDRTIIDPSAAEREIRIEVTGSGESTVFSPESIEVKAGETVKVVMRNNSQEAAFHGLRFNGPDGQYETTDDYVLPNVDPGFEDFAVIRYDAPGEFEFRDEQSIEGVAPAAGKVIVGESAATPDPDATPTPAPADVSLDVSATDAAFEPAELTVEAGKSFRITVTNNGTQVHNLRIAGPDGEWRTEDDIALDTFVNPGGKADLSGTIDTPGTYEFRDDFHPTVLTGTLTVQ